MVWLSWRLALVSLVTIPLMVALTTYIARRTRRGYRQQQRALGELNGLIEETISGARVVKAYGQEDAAIEVFESAR
jgi:ATP-binding cassette subfamily B multidrug efflux pump